MSTLDEIRAMYGDCVAGSIFLTREEYDACQTRDQLDELMRAKMDNARESLLDTACERWEAEK